MKQAYYLQLPKLYNHTDPIRRRDGFLSFIERATPVLSVVPETKRVLKDYPTIKPPRSKSAKKALFSFLMSNVDQSFHTMLSNQHQETGRMDGYDALEMFQLYCASYDDDEKFNALDEWKSARIQGGE